MAAPLDIFDQAAQSFDPLRGFLILVEMANHAFSIALAYDPLIYTLYHFIVNLIYYSKAREKDELKLLLTFSGLT